MIQLKASTSTKYVSEAILDHLFLLQASPTGETSNTAQQTPAQRLT